MSNIRVALVLPQACFRLSATWTVRQADNVANTGAPSISPSIREPHIVTM